MKKIVILGATGSIGDSTIELISHLPDQYEIVGITSNTSVDKLFNIADRFDVPYLHIMDDQAYADSKSKASNARVESGMDALLEYLANADYDLLVAAMVGNIGLLPVLQAIQANKTIALANKETLVSGGHLVQDLLL
ncbi:1-deoxy-D-xylulose-5-phosphate reductoisomerase, partial [bacterium]|nr:1-deoxy-D-xylulose-5-phosphate reductoisomerase [bacterium]